MRHGASTCVCEHNRQAASSRHAPLHHSTQLRGLLTYPTSVLFITESWQCYTGVGMSTSYERCWEGATMSDWQRGGLSSSGYVIKRLISGDLGWEYELWPHVDSVHFEHLTYSPIFYYCIELLVRTLSYFMWCFVYIHDSWLYYARYKFSYY